MRPARPTYSQTMLIFQIVWIFHYSSSKLVRNDTPDGQRVVNVFYFLVHNWGEKFDGDQMCPNMHCHWATSDDFQKLKRKRDDAMASEKSKNKEILTAAVSNVHSLHAKNMMRGPNNCDWRTNLTLATSEEAAVRYHHLFKSYFNSFDGYSTVSPNSNIQRVYNQAFLRPSDFYPEMHNFSYLIKAGSFVARDCHGKDASNSNRSAVVTAIGEGFRIEGLSKCMHSVSPEGVVLGSSRDGDENRRLKKEAISRFMFHIAFENSIESGYVTEKPFDALLSGTVPVYLGDSEHLRRLLPHPDAAIFVSDYNGNYTQLAEHLTYLSNNETAYEMHRQWRSNYSYENHIRDKPLLATSWTCRVCQWVADNAGKVPHIKTDEHCLDIEKSRDFHENISYFEGRLILWKAHKPSSYYIVANATLRQIPIEKTFEWLNIEAEDAVPVTYEEINKCKLGIKYHPI